MACYKPKPAWRCKDRFTDKGKAVIVFRIPFSESKLAARGKSKYYECQPIRCGRCIGCRLDYSREWAVRCTHEASMRGDSCFITLTYDDEHNPDDLVYKHFQDFMKRLRFYIDSRAESSPHGEQAKRASRISYYVAGEYGDNFGRPHFHALIFGFDFPDRRFFSRHEGYNLDTSDILSDLWPFGYVLVGDVSFDSAAYVARYVMKKVTGEHAEGWYGGRTPEFCKMSTKPAIGLGFFEAYKDSIYRDDFVSAIGSPEKKCKPPRYYDKKLAELTPDLLESLKVIRKARAEGNPHNMFKRLLVREKVKQASITTLRRKL